MSSDDASKCVDWKRKSFVHVFAQSSIFVLSQLEFGPHGFLDAISRIKTWGDLNALHISVSPATVSVQSNSERSTLQSANLNVAGPNL